MATTVTRISVQDLCEKEGLASSTVTQIVQYEIAEPVDAAIRGFVAREGGTGSILDMHTLSVQSGPGVVAPLSDAILTALFTTRTPSRAQVEANLQGLIDARAPGEGSYVIVYENDQPHEICFAGRGD